MSKQALQTELKSLYAKYGIRWHGGEDCGYRTNISIPFKVIKRIAKLRRMIDIYNGQKVLPIIIYIQEIPTRAHGFTFNQLMKKDY